MKRLVLVAAILLLVSGCEFFRIVKALPTLGESTPATTRGQT